MRKDVKTSENTLLFHFLKIVLHVLIMYGSVSSTIRGMFRSASLYQTKQGAINAKEFIILFK
jgi:hypothetical protein